MKVAAGAGEARRMRLDKWLWAARFYKTRGVATDEIDKGRVHVNGLAAKPSREVHIDDRIEMRQANAGVREVVVIGLSDVRGPAPVAQLLYAETPESIAAREKAAQERRDGTEPSQAIEQGRPTKRDRRQLTDWTRWSVSLDE